MIIAKDEATAARRRIPARIFTSNGTSPDTGAVDDPVIMGTNSLGTFSVSSTLRGMNANNGMYFIELTQSEVSVAGVHPLYHTAGDFCQHFANAEVVNFGPYSTQSNLDLSANTVLASARLGSAVTLAGGVYSDVSVRVQAGDYGSHTSFGVSTIKPGVYSSVSFSVRDAGLAPTSGQVGWFDAAGLASDAGQEIADRWLARNIAGGSDGGRTNAQVQNTIRNRVVLSGLTGTVYEIDDATSSYTFSLTTTDAVAINSIDPGGV